MKSITRALLIACLVLPVIACGKKEDTQQAQAAPVAAPTTEDKAAWNAYLNEVASRHMEGINNSPYVYLVPPPPANMTEAPPADAQAPADGEASDLSTPVDGNYERLLDKAKLDVARGIVRGNLLIYAGLNSARTADLTVASFEEVEPGTMKGVRVLFIGEEADNARVKAAVEPAGVEYVFVDTAK
ncbi:hypothetical protein [Luteimonas sp. RC10]|uniref:hypothetical protein n=1 Tax=Luteimonas sp. RC10 TaxID=2587035 RepID=UPI00161A6BDA|nr:hypothetical protein [Luteimonas sp. RC10]MBB3343472.1 hypothetical protein [Luteimonas sp. RC10]